MKTLIATTLAGLCCATIAGAALPPFHASAWIMRTIMDSAEVETAINGGFVEGLELLGTTDAGDQTWRVRTQGCSVTVQLQQKPMIGMSGMPLVGRVDYTVAEVSACIAD